MTLLGSRFSDRVSSLDSELAQAADGTALLWIFKFWTLHRLDRSDAPTG
jgi:hypothetical protein